MKKAETRTEQPRQQEPLHLDPLPPQDLNRQHRRVVPYIITTTTIAIIESVLSLSRYHDLLQHHVLVQVDAVEPAPIRSGGQYLAVIRRK
jgi:hypothetical protein